VLVLDLQLVLVPPSKRLLLLLNLRVKRRRKKTWVSRSLTKTFI